MENYFFNILGITVSIVTFFITYRMTIGAKKERAQSANLEIEKILIRRIVLEDYKPNSDDVIRLIEGKSRDFKVKINDLLSVNQFFNSIFTHILETDFLAKQQRNIIIKEIVEVLEENDVNNNLQSEPIRVSKHRNQNTLSIFMAIFATSIGGIVSIIPSLSQLKLSDLKFPDMDSTLLMTLIISLLLIILIIIFQRTREFLQTDSISSSSRAIEKAIDFEKSISKLLVKIVGKHNVSPSNLNNSGYDFVIIINNKKVLIEAKSWNGQVAKQQMDRTIRSLKEAVLKEKTNIGIIVTMNFISSNELKIDDVVIYTVYIKDLKNIIKKLRNDT